MADTSPPIVFSIGINGLRWNRLFNSEENGSSRHPAVVHFAQALAASDEFQISYANHKCRYIEDLWAYLTRDLKQVYDQCTVAWHLDRAAETLSLATRMADCREPIGVLRGKFFLIFCPKHTPFTTALHMKQCNNGLTPGSDMRANGHDPVLAPAMVVPKLRRLVTASRIGGSQIW